MFSDKDIPVELEKKEKELLEIRKSIDVARKKLNKMIEEGAISSEETLKISQQLDKLIRDYCLKSMEFKKG